MKRQALTWNHLMPVSVCVQILLFPFFRMYPCFCVSLGRLSSACLRPVNHSVTQSALLSSLLMITRYIAVERRILHAGVVAQRRKQWLWGGCQSRFPRGGDILKGWGGRAASWKSLRDLREPAQGCGWSCRGGSGMTDNCVRCTGNQALYLPSNWC